MTIQERVQAALCGIQNAKAISALAQQLAKTPFMTDFQKQPEPKRNTPLAAGFSLQLRAATADTCGPFADEATAAKVHARLMDLANDMCEIWADKVLEVINEFDDMAETFLSPTVTIQSNGVNVEVK